MFLMAATASGHRGGLFGRYGIARRENIGAVRAFDTFPPTKIATPSPSASAIGIAGQTVKQLPQYMQRSRLMLTDLVPALGMMACVGQERTVFGISHTAATLASSMRGGFRWMPTMARSEQWTAPHMLRQHATATRRLAGSFISTKYSYSSSIMDFTRPEASVAALWQWTQPCVWMTLEIEWPVPPTGRPCCFSSSSSGAT